MHRGEFWISADKGYMSKPKPVLIMQSNRYDLDESVVTCLITTIDVIEKEYRVAIPKTELNGLDKDSFAMIDKLITIPREKLNKFVGKIEDNVMNEVYARVIDFLDR